MLEVRLFKAPRKIEVSGKFDASCTIRLATRSLEAVRKGRLKLRVGQVGTEACLSNVSIDLASADGDLNIVVGCSGARIVMGEDTAGSYDLRLWRHSAVTIGNRTTSNGTRIVCDNSSVEIGGDCMFSDQVLIQSADQHGIVDLHSGQIINGRMRKLVVADHVWLGRQSLLLPDVSIGRGSIIGAGAVVSKDVPELSIAAGVPAKVVRSGVTWSRSPDGLDESSAALVREYREGRGPA